MIRLITTYRPGRSALSWPILTAVVLICALQAPAGAQAITRSSGMGMRLSFQNSSNHQIRYTVPGFARDVDINASGVGLWVYHFRRIYNNWFLEFNLGVLGSSRANNAPLAVEPSTVIPFLIGTRYDVDLQGVPDNMMPYVSLGGGPFWMPNMSVRDDQTGETRRRSVAEIAGYMGVGTDFLLREGMTFNLEIKSLYYGLGRNLDARRVTNINNLALNMGVTFSWGRQRQLFEIVSTQVIAREIYPAYQQYYNNYPLAILRVRNTSGYPIEVNLRCSVPPYSPREKATGYIRLARGEVKDIPVSAYFGPALASVDQRATAMLEIAVSGRAGETFSEAFNEQIVVHNRNAWNGDMEKLIFFITPQDALILNTARAMVTGDSLAETPVTAIDQARLVFEALGDLDIRYLKDPNIPFYQDDHVQYGRETLTIKSGDCDDLVVMYASLLESIGIHTAFVEVQDPQRPLAHLYLLMDSGIPAASARQVSENEKRYILRGDEGRRTVWIPLETTLLQKGFDAAWRAGALQYLQEAILRNGIGEGWVKIIDIP